MGVSEALSGGLLAEVSATVAYDRATNEGRRRALEGQASRDMVRSAAILSDGIIAGALIVAAHAQKTSVAVHCECKKQR